MIRMVTSSEHCASAILFLHSYNDDDEDDDDDIYIMMKCVSVCNEK